MYADRYIELLPLADQDVKMLPLALFGASAAIFAAAHGLIRTRRKRRLFATLLLTIALIGGSATVSMTASTGVLDFPDLGTGRSASSVVVAADSHEYALAA